MVLALVMAEKYTGGSMELTHHSTLRTVDNKGTPAGHEGDGPEIDLLFLDVANGGRAGLRVHIIDNEPNRNVNRNFIGHAAADALLYGVLSLPKGIGNILKGGCTSEILNGENRFKHQMDAHIIPFFRGHISL